MKGLFAAVASSLLIFVLIASSSCKKIIDEIIKHPSNGVVSDCRIEKIIARSKYMYTNSKGEKVPYYDTAYFTYNKVGNPVSLKHSLHKTFPEERALGDRVYQYDSQNHLRTYLFGYQRISSSGLDVADSWNVFEFRDDGLITHDMYSDASAPASGGGGYNSISEIPTNYTNLITVRYSTDDMGRIVVTEWGGFLDHKSYDASGNLVGNGYTYSKNYSYLQTNKVWMLLANNYSVNARTAPLDPYGDDNPVQFNARKLPTKFQGYPTAFGPGRGVLADATVIYKCK